MKATTTTPTHKCAAWGCRRQSTRDFCHHHFYMLKGTIRTRLIMSRQGTTPEHMLVVNEYREAIAELEGRITPTTKPFSGGN